MHTNNWVRRLWAHNFKGGSFAHDLETVKVVAGRNEKGKTERVKAMVMAEMG